MVDSLRSQTIHALSWSFLESIVLQGVRFGSGIVLARLLLPEQFGLIGMLAIFIAVTESFLDGGFGAALIQKREATESDTCSIFYFNIVVGFGAAGLLCLVAPWIADFYKEPTLTPLLRVMSLSVVINSFGLIHNTILTKQIDFKTQTKVSLIATTLSGIIGISLAATGFGVWSLAAQQVSGNLFRTVFLWALHGWRPAMIFNFRALRTMFGFGSRLLFSNLLNQIFGNIYLVVIGKLFSATTLGYFTRAKIFPDVPSVTLSEIVRRVTFPVFSTVQDDRERLKRGVKKVLEISVLVNFPMMIGLAVVARPLVLVLLTEKWEGCIPYLQLLCLGGLLYPLHVINLNILQALGRSELFLRLEIIKKVLVVINIAIAWRWGIYALIYGMIAMSILSYYLNSYYTGVLIGYPMREQLRDLFLYLIVALLMGTAVYAAGLLPFPNHWGRLLAQVGSGVVIYACFCWFFRVTAFREIWQTWWNKLPLLRVGPAA